MYKSNELLESVPSSQKQMVGQLIEDIDEFNSKYCERGFELYIDYDGDYSIRAKKLNDEKGKYSTNVMDCLSIECLDMAIATLIAYNETFYDSEYSEFHNDLVKTQEVDGEKILSNKDKIYFNTVGGLVPMSIEHFSELPFSEQLFNLNRTLGQILDERDKPKFTYTQEWINKIAMIRLLRFYYDRYNELKDKLAKVEDNAIVSKIM